MGATFWGNVLVYLLFIWSLFWKGIALWRASQLKQRNWFVVLLVLNTIGILELIYLFRFAKKKLSFDEMKSWRKYFIKRVPQKN